MTYPEVTGLQVQIGNALRHIDQALDRGDRRAFRLWSSRWRDLTARCGGLLTKIATTHTSDV